MILAGIFNQIEENTFKNLDSFVSKKISKDKLYFKNNFVNIIAGKTSYIIDEGIILNLKGALLIGSIFKKDTYEAIKKEDLENQPEISNKLFVEKYWGNYLYVRVNEKIATILRDPIGQFPLFHTKLDSGECLFSTEIDILIDMMQNKPSYNWRYFSSYIIHSFITTEQTAFDGIYELPHGCQISYNPINGLMEHSIIWNPLDFIKNYKGREKTKDDIINTISNVLKCWTRNADVVSLDFSGGTDSTGLLFVLNNILNINQKIKLVNLYHPDVSSSDERKYARAAANHLGLDLIEFDQSKSLPYDPICDVMRFKPNWPTSLLSYLKTNNDISSLINKSKNIIYMSGHGGDHIFMCPPPITSLCDYLIEQGGKGFNRKLEEIYTMFREPLFTILLKMTKGFMRYYLCSHYNQSTHVISHNKMAPWINKEVFLLEKQIRYHPFFYSPGTTKCLPGKFALIEAIYSGLSTIKGVSRNGGTNLVFFPLFSQPMLELVLSIPTYETYQNGYNRYLFRKAISDIFKINAVWRQDKGETSGISQRGLKKNKDRILELCLDGNMVKQGLINKKRLHVGIFEVINGQIDYDWAATNLICAEIFMNYWS